jgi:hypothetical protein
VEGKARAALAELCVLQGRLAEAERQMGDDRARAARLLGIVVWAQLALGDSGGAAEATARLAELADDARVVRWRRR